MSDDLQKQRIKRVGTVVDRVTNGFNSEYNKQNYYRLVERKNRLSDKMVDESFDDITRSNARLQFQEIELALSEMEKNINFDEWYDTSVDKDAARKFIDEHNLLEEGEHLISQNDELDKLEANLYNKKK